MSSKVTASATRQNLSEIVSRAAYGGERTIVHRRKKPVAAVVPIEDLEFLEAVEDRMDIEEARRRLNEPTIPWSKIKKELGL
jgi:antitoxin Phd